MALLPAFGLIFLAFSHHLAHFPVQALTPFQPSDGRQHQSHARNSIPFAEPEPSYRLPTTIIPSKYQLTIQPILKPHPSFQQYSIPGFVNIEVECKEATKTITLHARDIEFQNIRVLDSSGLALLLNGSEQGNGNDFYHIHLQEELVVNRVYSLRLEFISKISQTDLYGMYLSYYLDETTGERRELATTTMHATHARSLFPCFDEPHLKAEFSIAVASEISMTSLSNSDIAFSIVLDNYRFNYFRPTPPMSTYLVAVVISDFSEVSASLAEFPKPIRVWGPPSYIDAKGGDYAVEVVPKVMNYFQDFANFTFDLPKLDSVAIPQFAFGAMENWGLITYRLERLMHIPGENTEADRKRIAQIISHEVAHQWHGNVITYDWWSEAWLTEGFASFLEFRGMQVASPEFNSDIAIISDSVQDAMIFDQGPNTHPLAQSEVTPDQASAFFDTIAYEKGASLLRMLESVLTREKFDNGVRRFIADNAYGSVVSTDLWNSLQTEGGDELEAGLTVAEFMRQWTILPGYPLVRVTVAGPRKIFVTQEKFMLNPGAVATQDSRFLSSWHIPISVITSDNPNIINRSPDFWLYTTQSLTSYDVDTTKWLVLNAEAAGYFRVLYDNHLLGHIKHQLDTDHTAFTPGTRSQLLEDYFQLAKARYIPMETALDLTSYLGSETELVVWTPVLAHLKDLLRRLSHDPTSEQAFKDYLLPKVQQALLNDDIQDDVGADMILRTQLFDLAVTLGHPEQKDVAQILFNQWLEEPGNRTLIPVDLRPTVYCAGMETANQQAWDTLNTLYQTEKYSWTKAQLLKALSCSANPDILTNYIELAKNGTDFCLEDTLTAVAENSIIGRPIAYEFIKNLVVEDPSEKTGTIFAKVLSAIQNYIHEQNYLNEIIQFVDMHKEAFPSALPSINSSIGKIRDNVQWWSEVGRNVASWCRAKSP